ncbi:glycosyltransferase [Streptococcus cameli]
MHFPQHSYHVFTLTASENLEQLGYLIQNSQSIHFHIATYTTFGHGLAKFKDYENVTLYPSVNYKQIDELLMKTNAYLDINHAYELDNIVSRFKQFCKPILAFETTKHGEKGQFVFPDHKPEQMVDKLEQLAQNFFKTREIEKVTIVVPVYNGKAGIARCLKSIQAQTFTHFEVIVVDDGSTDGSLTIAKEAVGSDNRFKFYRTLNQGTSAARNFGIERSTTQNIAFIDSDDYVSEDYLEILILALIDTNADIVSCSFVEDFSEFSRKDSPLARYSPDQAQMTHYQPLEAIRQLDFKQDQRCMDLWHSWGKVFRKHLFSNLRFPVGRIHQDAGLGWQLFLISNKIVHVNADIYFYYHRNGSIMHTPAYSKKRLYSAGFLEERIIGLTPYNHPMGELKNKLANEYRYHIQQMKKQDQQTYSAELEIFTYRLQELEKENLSYLFDKDYRTL